MLPHWRRLIWQGLHSIIDPKAGTSVYCEHFSIFFFFFFFFFFLFIYLFIYFFFFCIFYRLSNGSLVIGHCKQIFNLVSIWMQIKLGILSIQTFVWQHEHAVSRFQIWWALKPLGLLMPRPPARTALWFKICLWNLLKINELGECIRLLTFGCLVSHGRKLA